MIIAELDEIITGEKMPDQIWKEASRLSIVYSFPEKLKEIENNFSRMCALLDSEFSGASRNLSIRDFQTKYDMYVEKAGK